jgi:hypothetical protein
LYPFITCIGFEVLIKNRYNIYEWLLGRHIKGIYAVEAASLNKQTNCLSFECDVCCDEAAEITSFTAASLMVSFQDQNICPHGDIDYDYTTFSSGKA